LGPIHYCVVCRGGKDGNIYHYTVLVIQAVIVDAGVVVDGENTSKNHLTNK